MLGRTYLLLLPVLAAALPPPPVDGNPPIAEACQRLADDARRGYGYPLWQIEFFQKCKATVKPKTKEGAPLYRCTHDPANCITQAEPLMGESAVLCRTMDSDLTPKESLNEEPKAWKLVNGLYVYNTDVEGAFLRDVLNSAPPCYLGVQSCQPKSVSPLKAAGRDHCEHFGVYSKDDREAGDGYCLDLPETDEQTIHMWNPAPPALLTDQKTVRTSMVAVFKGKDCQGAPVSIFGEENRSYEHKPGGDPISVRVW